VPESGQHSRHNFFDVDLTTSVSTANRQHIIPFLIDDVVSLLFAIVNGSIPV
jgi:hypothetical protein